MSFEQTIVSYVGCMNSGTFLVVFLCGLVFSASGWFVTLLSADPTTIRVPDDYPTIQEAIDAASPGDTIQVAAGAYYERVTVNKTVTLMGEGPLTTIIDGDIDVINVSYVVISRFTIIHLTGDGILLERCRDSIINNNVIEGAGRYAIDLLYSEGNIFTNNSVLDNRDGVALFESNQNFFINNKISRNHRDGIIIVESGNNFFSGNEISENGEHGITLVTQYTCGNIFEGNTISKNDYAIVIADAYDNAVYHNNFIDNGKQIAAYNEMNIWDWGYPSGGNYWSSHNPPDIYSGPYQNETGSDGIGDIPYIMDENNTDRYPLIYPYSYVPSPDVNGDEIVDVFDVVTVAEAFGSIPRDPNWNPAADIVQDEVIDIFDVVTVAGNFGKLLDA